MRVEHTYCQGMVRRRMEPRRSGHELHLNIIIHGSDQVWWALWECIMHWLWQQSVGWRQNLFVSNELRLRLYCIRQLWKLLVTTDPAPRQIEGQLRSRKSIQLSGLNCDASVIETLTALISARVLKDEKLYSSLNIFSKNKISFRKSWILGGCLKLWVSGNRVFFWKDRFGAFSGVLTASRWKDCLTL